MVDTHQHARDNIRANIRTQRRALTHKQLGLAGENLSANCTTFLHERSSVAGYQAMQGEIPLTTLFAYCHNNNITTLLPIMRGQSLMFAPFDQASVFTTKQFGIQEPDVPEREWLAPDELDLVLVPLVAFDRSCNRIGMGGGFYDRSFAFRQNTHSAPTLLGVAHALQQVDDVFAQAWDVALDFIATDEQVFSSV